MRPSDDAGSARLQSAHLLGWRGGVAEGFGERIDAVGRDRVLLLTRDESALPVGVPAWLATAMLGAHRVATPDAVMHEALRGRPRLVLVDGRGDRAGSALTTCRRLKADSFTAIVPTVCVSDGTPEGAAAAFTAGADEVVHDGMTPLEVEARLTAMLRRADRDVGVHPTTRLPGTPALEEELTRRLAAHEPFAACYADLDHFKEFNDRYGYNEGDRVIRMLGRILHDVVKGHVGERGFVGHIGGDDFLYVVPLDRALEICATVVDTFELLVPYQYSEPDRRAGYYFGKDRRGRLHRVPLMSLSIGVATTERRRFTSALQVSRLASEMKSYAKTQPGSLYAVDRRVDEAAESSAGPRTEPSTENSQ